MKILVLLSKGVSETIQNEAKEQKRRFLSMLLGILHAGLLGNILSGNRVISAGDGAKTKRQGKGIIRAGYGNKKHHKIKWIFYATSSFN